MKDTIFISKKYSGRIFKKQWMESFLDKKHNLKEINENPYPWQKLLKDLVLSNKPENRIVDWLVDPVSNTGKSSFARAYCSDENSEAILMKIDNLDLSLGGNIFSDDGYRYLEVTDRKRFNLNSTYKSKKTLGLSYGINANFLFQSTGSAASSATAAAAYTLPCAATLGASSIMQSNATYKWVNQAETSEIWTVL